MLATRVFNPYGSWRGAFSDIDRLRQDMGRLLGALGGEVDKIPTAGVFPLVNIAEGEDGYTITAELPGVLPEDLDISVVGKSVGLKGERKQPELPEGAKFHRRERSYLKFSRMLGLPEEVDADKVTAILADGVLTLKAPKAAAARPKKISINAA